MGKIIKEPPYFVSKSYVDEKNKLVIVPLEGEKLEVNDYFLIGSAVEKKYPNLSFSSKYALDNDSVIFYLNE